MVARPALIRQSDVTRIMRGAKDAGITMGIVVTTGEVRFVPVDEMEPEQKLSGLDQWKAKRDARKAKAQAGGRS
ncbi:hypothetical protein GCM10007989_07880 [Devosia pacifica]|uniref:Uncharacterized protein n=1 Tax=Devosia pacifica TaxID=1335967 RepID=A0A918RY28_9HYPH|nr:hypothetical protein GCM10007989_07880 [Devosia pacifica]